MHAPLKGLLRPQDVVGASEAFAPMTRSRPVICQAHYAPGSASLSHHQLRQLCYRRV